MTEESPRRNVGEELFVIATEQMERRHFGVAIVVAQTVIEAATEAAFHTLIAASVPQSTHTLMALLPDGSFQERATRTLWTELTGDDIKEPRAAWRAYCAHVERRNRAAHGSISSSTLSGKPDLSQADAEASLRAVRDLWMHIANVFGEQVGQVFAGGVNDWDALRALRVLGRVDPPST